MNLFERLQEALSRCEFPGMDKFEFEIALHRYGFGEHSLYISTDVINTNERRHLHKWKDQFGNQYEEWQNPGDRIGLSHDVRFSYQDEYPPMFFENLIFRLYAELGTHELFENFALDGRRMFDPHSSRHVIDSETGKVGTATWRNVALWRGVQAAMLQEPKYSPIEKVLLAEHRLGKKILRARSDFWNWWVQLKMRETREEKVRWTCVMINNLTYGLAGFSIRPIQLMEEWLTNRKWRRKEHSLTVNKEAV